MTIIKSTEIAGAGRYPGRRLSKGERKVVEVAEQYEAASPGDWGGVAPTTQDAALDALAAGTVSNAEVTGELTSAQLLAMNATPIELISAPGAGKSIVVEEVELFLDFNTAAYAADAGEDLVIRYVTSGTAISTWDDADPIVEGTGDERSLDKPDARLDLSDSTNNAVEAAILVGEWATGDSPIKYRIKYRVVTELT